MGRWLHSRLAQAHQRLKAYTFAHPDSRVALHIDGDRLRKRLAIRLVQRVCELQGDLLCRMGPKNGRASPDEAPDSIAPPPPS